MIEEQTSTTSGDIQKRVNYSYDTCGHLSSITTLQNSQPSTIQYEYHPSGRLLSVNSSKSGKVSYAYKKTQDAMGQTVPQVEITYENGNVELVTYDALERPVEKALFHQGSKVKSAQFAYDVSGKLCKKTTQPSYSLFSFERLFGSQDRQVQWSYDLMGRLVSIKDAENRVTQFNYNKLGQLISKIKPSGNQVSFTYSSLGSIETINAHASSTGQKLNESYRFKQDADNLEEIEATRSSPDKKLKAIVYRSHNPKNQITSECICVTGYPVEVNFSYDLQGRKKSITLPDKTEVCFDYEGNELRSMTRKSSIGRALYVREFKGSDLTGAVKPLISGNSFSESTGSNHFNVTVTDKAECDASGLMKSHLSQGQTSQFSYDFMGQLTKESGYYENEFAYDLHGNLTSIDGAVAKYDRSNRILSLGKQTYSHTLDGHLQSEGSDSKK